MPSGQWCCFFLHVTPSEVGRSSVYRCCGVLNNWHLSPYGKRQKSLVVKYVHSDSQTLWVQIPALPLVTCVPSSKLLSLSLTWFLPLSNRDLSVSAYEGELRWCLWNHWQVSAPLYVLSHGGCDYPICMCWHFPFCVSFTPSLSNFLKSNTIYLTPLWASISCSNLGTRNDPTDTVPVLIGLTYQQGIQALNK